MCAGPEPVLWSYCPLPDNRLFCAAHRHLKMPHVHVSSVAAMLRPGVVAIRGADCPVTVASGTCVIRGVADAHADRSPV